MRHLSHPNKNHVFSYRTARQISQTELARVTGISRRTLSSLENQNHNPSVYVALRFAMYFRVPVESLFETSHKK